MTELRYRTGLEFRVRSQLGRAVAGFGVAGVLAYFLSQLLEMPPEQWRWFFWMMAAFAVVYGVFVQVTLGRVDGEIRRGIDADVDGTLDSEGVRRSFAACVRFPIGGIVFSLVTWVGAGAMLPLTMLARFHDFAWANTITIFAFTLAGGVTCGVFTYLMDRRAAEPLRDRWAARIPDPVEREGLVAPLTLGRKLRVALTGLVLSAALLAAVVGDVLSQRPIESYATRIQAGYLERMARRVDGPRDPMLRIAREDLLELGIGAELVVVDLRDGSIADGPEDALTPSELAWIARGGGNDGANSVGFHSANAFAWAPIEVDEDHVLVTVIGRAALTGDLSHTRLLLGLLALFTATVGFVCAHYLALDVGRTVGRLRSQAERIASGDLSSVDIIECEDELGVLARSFQRMSSSLRATVGRVAEAADGVEAAAGEIADAGGSVAASTSEQGAALDQARRSMTAVHGEIAGITDSVQLLNGSVEEASSSVLELGAAGEQLNHTASSLSEQVETASSSVEQMVRSAGQIGENTEALSSAAAETSSSMTEMAASMRDVDTNASETARLSAQVVSLADRGRERVRQTIEGMDAIRDATDSVQGAITGLGGRIQEIGAIVDVIDDVADETSLLALNAAIIAAQAGDQGRAFSVVADEIAELADRVLASTKEIGSLIRAVQSESTKAIRAIEGGAASVHQGVELAAEAGVSLEEITAAARTSGDRIEEIVQAVREQTRAAAHVADLMERVSRGVGEIQRAGEEQARGNEVVMRSTQAVRDVSQQVHRTTEEQARGASRIRDSMESVRDAVEHMHASLRQQSTACREVASLVDQVFERTHRNEEATSQMSEATRALRAQAESLRQDVRRFRL